MKLFKFKKILYKDYVEKLQYKLNHANQVINMTNQTMETVSLSIDNYIIEQKACEEKEIIENMLIQLEEKTKRQKV